MHNSVYTSPYLYMHVVRWLGRHITKHFYNTIPATKDYSLEPDCNGVLSYLVYWSLQRSRQPPPSQLSKPGQAAGLSPGDQGTASNEGPGKSIYKLGVSKKPGP